MAELGSEVASYSCSGSKELVSDRQIMLKQLCHLGRVQMDSNP